MKFQIVGELSVRHGEEEVATVALGVGGRYSVRGPFTVRVVGTFEGAEFPIDVIAGALIVGKGNDVIEVDGGFVEFAGIGEAECKAFMAMALGEQQWDEETKRLVELHALRN